jgi:hypothetical protein
MTSTAGKIEAKNLVDLPLLRKTHYLKLYDKYGDTVVIPAHAEPPDGWSLWVVTDQVDMKKMFKKRETFTAKYCQCLDSEKNPLTQMLDLTFERPISLIDFLAEKTTISVELEIGEAS